MRGIRRFVREQGVVSYFMRNRRWVTLSICLISSVLLWLMVTLGASEGYTKVVRVVVHSPSLPPNYVVTDSTDFPRELEVKIHASGSALFKYSLDHIFDSHYGFTPYVDTMTLNPEGGEWRLSMAELKTQVLSREFPDVRKIVPDTVQSFIISPAEMALSYMPLMRQEVEVVFGSQVDYGDRANLRLVDSVAISPSAVYIYGSQERLNELREIQPFVQTDSVSIKLSNPGQTSHKLALLAPAGTRLYPDSVSIILTTEELLHYTQVVNSIDVQNLPSGYSIKLLPETVKVTYLIPKVIGTDDEKFDFRLFVDASDVLSGAKKTLDVRLRDVPKNVEMIQLVPDKLEFILTEITTP